jgi:hypothetical protein
MNSLIPSFDWYRVIVQPWVADFPITLWIVLMGFFVTAAWTCRQFPPFAPRRGRDAISHSILPGLVVAFAFKGDRGGIRRGFGCRIVDGSDHRIHSQDVGPTPRSASLSRRSLSRSCLSMLE